MERVRKEQIEGFWILQAGNNTNIIFGMGNRGNHIYVTSDNHPLSWKEAGLATVLSDNVA